MGSIVSKFNRENFNRILNFNYTGESDNIFYPIEYPIDFY